MVIKEEDLFWCYEPDLPEDSSESFALGADHVKHLLQVLRKKEGDQIIITNGMGRLWKAKILETGKKQIRVDLENSEYHLPAKHRLTLGIAFTKNASRNEWILEKAVELGVAAILPLQTERGDKYAFKLQRAQTILKSAAIQSRKPWFPELLESVPFKRIFSDRTPDLICIAHCQEEPAREDIKDINFSVAETLILIGPEGDFGPEEINLAYAAGAKGLALGSARLRTETAALVACTHHYLQTSL